MAKEVLSGKEEAEEVLLGGWTEVILQILLPGIFGFPAANYSPWLPVNKAFTVISKE